MTDDILTDDAVEEGGRRGRRRGRGRKKEQAEKAPKAKKRKDRKAQAAPTGEATGSPIARLRQWLLDSYNGIFKILLQPQLPSMRVLFFMVISFLVGMFWAYNLAPVQFYNAAPHQMRDEHQDQYVIGVAASALAGIYNDEGVATLLNRVDSPAQRVERLKGRGGQTEAALEAVDEIAQSVPGRDMPSAGNIFTTVIEVIVAVVAFVLVASVVAIAWGLLIGGYFDRARLTIKRRFVGESEADIRARQTMDAERKRKEMRRQMEEEARTAAATDLGTPLLTRPSIYTKGRAFDDSFAIEDADDMFLGETGATIAKTIGDSQELAAVEIWLFDKDDFVKTYTKVFVSEHGYNDPMVRSDLEVRVDEPATDIVILRQGSELTLESNNLVVKAKVIDTSPGMDPSLPPNSHFEGLTIQMQAWQKQGEAVTVGMMPGAAGAGGLPDVSSYDIGPPPDMPSSPPPGGLPDVSSYDIGPPPEIPQPRQQPPSAPPQQEPVGWPPPQARPPQSQPPEELPPFDDDEDDDPFGGTADFTPLGR
ncbi:MAG: hypothetical protein ACOCYT_03790 [Chloroflexota bacterium]